MGEKKFLGRKFGIFLMSVVFLAAIGFYSFVNQTGYVGDVLFGAVLLFILLLLYRPFRLTPLSYSLICFAVLVHNLGGFGFYARPPLSIPFDIVTHFLGIFAATIIVGNILSPLLHKRYRAQDLVILFMILLGGLGVGSLIENSEFTGYLILGEGKGGFRFGEGDVDTIPGVDLDELTYLVGGGYFDAMWDLLVNLAAALTAVIVFALVFYRFKRQRI